ncbi:MAG: Flp family type IVb pilin [Alphaproteobacteria bacterium]|nr:Flp family type IVb pilin [Alphaproteobacteria bacterium]
MTELRTLPADTRGVTALEYALIAAIIGVVIVGAMQGVGNSLMQNLVVIVEAAREAPQPMDVVDKRLPKPPVRATPRAEPAPMPDLDDDESSDLPEQAAEAQSPGDTADTREPGALEPGITLSEPAMGPREEDFPVTALVTPSGRDSTQIFAEGGGTRSGGTGRVAVAPPGRETSGEGGREPAGAERAAPAPAPPMFNAHQKAAIRSAFILLMWAVFAVGLGNLIWRIATRKAHEKEVEDQLEGWQPASFG